MVLTYQDLEKVLTKGGSELAAFVLDAVREHQASQIYLDAVTAERYATGHNALIEQYQKLLYTLTGETVPDNFTANHKCKSGFFKRFVTQRAAFLLGNGVSFENKRNRDTAAEFYAERQAVSLGRVFCDPGRGGIMTVSLSFFKSLSALVCGCAGFLWGQLDGLLLALIAFMVLDYITGLIVGAVQHKLNSQISFAGLAKKALILVIVAVAHIVDTQILGGSSSVFRSAACGLYIANEGLSILVSPQ